MRILLHDYAGHPFQFELSAELAKRGHDVTHTYFAGDLGPKGRVSGKLSYQPGLTVHPIIQSARYSKDRLLQRFWNDLGYATELTRLIVETRPDVVLSGNSPPYAQWRALKTANGLGSGFVHWSQDVYSLAVRDALAKKGFLVRRLAAPYVRRLERKIHKKADAVIAVADSFKEAYRSLGFSFSHGHVIANWGPLASIEVDPEGTVDWRQRLGLENVTVFLFSGTLGSKHAPELLAELARRIAGGNRRITGGEKSALVIATNARGTMLLRRHEPMIDQLAVLLPLQPFENLSGMLGTADVLLATLSSEASRYSVPSKIWSYMCAGRPILLAAPEKNDASQAVLSCGGTVVDPGDTRAWLNAAERLAKSERERRAVGANMRQYAEQNFEIGRICSRFEHVLKQAANRRSPSSLIKNDVSMQVS